jgi:molybdate transport system substrate-binding protein
MMQFQRKVVKRDSMRLTRQLIIFVLLILVSCNSLSEAPSGKNATQLTIFAAASLTEVFTEMVAEFEAGHPGGLEVWLNFAGSQTLRLQIEQGAQADVFASANQQHANALWAADLIQAPVIFTHNQLVVIMPANNPASIKTLADLTKPGLKLILASPNVPIGRYARQSLEKLNTNPTLGVDFSRRVLNNLVSEEDNVKGVVAKVQLGEADAGIVYASDVTPAVADALATLVIPPEFNVVADYPIAVVTGSDQPGLAQAFIDFVLSAQGQAILANHNFQPAQPQFTGGEP